MPGEACAHIQTRPSESLQHKNQPTGGDSLPAEEERRPGLDGVAEDRAVVVRPGRPGHRGGGLRHLGHPTVPRRPRGTWRERQVSHTEINLTNKLYTCCNGALLQPEKRVDVRERERILFFLSVFIQPELLTVLLLGHRYRHPAHTQSGLIALKCTR